MHRLKECGRQYDYAKVYPTNCMHVREKSPEFSRTSELLKTHEDCGLVLTRQTCARQWNANGFRAPGRAFSGISKPQSNYVDVDSETRAARRHRRSGS
ncbi:hypothetical protein EVAR_41037_1 [Eumeta japonica]|uniref:Uncharacterized protein n=1 Tax=Eumeta variegata TaxID=151549 RepID=A0A4C1YX49_EUMVA|nr:hypothetical protein EVAR_41037_1 [Eumeta japonica]